MEFLRSFHRSHLGAGGGGGGEPLVASPNVGCFLMLL